MARKNCSFFGWILPALFAVGLFLSIPARAADEVSLDFVNTDIAAVAKAVGYITEHNFILDPRVKGTINIVSAKPVPKDQIYDVFLSALRTQGFTIVKGRGAYKIVPEADAKLNYTVTAGKKLRTRDESLVTQVYPLQFADAAQMLPVLRPLISPNNVVSALTLNNMLVITDYADNLKRIDRLIEAMDQPAGRNSDVIRLKYAVAGDVAGLLQKLLGENSDVPSQRVYFAADTRSNTLLVRSENPSRIQQVRQLVAEMDTPDSQAAGPRVLHLHNADATKLVQTLRGALSGDASGSGAASAATAGSADKFGINSKGVTSAPAATASASAADGQLQILADVPANAVILVGPAVLQAQYAQVIEKLDTRPAQVFIEALIVEMSADKARELGIQWQFLNGVNKNSASLIGGTNFGGTGTNILGVSQNLSSISAGINLGVIDGTVSIPITNSDGTTTQVSLLNLGVLAHALEAQTGIHILSAPNLLTLDNEPAKIVVGQNVPFVTGQYTLNTTGGVSSPFQTIQRQDVGLTLEVKPQVGSDGNIRLQLHQEVSNVQSVSSVNGPTTNKRSIDTTVMVDDRHIVVLGGLMQDTYQDETNKVPLLGDLPVLGHLFRSNSRSQVKTDLFVFLRPVIVRDRQGLNDLSKARYDYVKDRAAGVDRYDMPLDNPAASQLWLKPDVAPKVNPDQGATVQ